MFNKVEKLALDEIISVLINVVRDHSEQAMIIFDLKFSLNILVFFFLFLLLWQQMVSSMKRNIINALWLLNILPTSYLAISTDFIKEIQASSLVT